MSPGALRADIGPGPITYGELAEALAYDHPVVRAQLTGRELRALADAAGFYRPSELEPARSYGVAASEMLLPHGRRSAPRSRRSPPTSIAEPALTRYSGACRSSTATSRSSGPGVVGCAIARELTRFELRVTLLEAGPDVGAGTSKANTALLHTGFDAKPGTLEARLVARGFDLLGEYAERVGIPSSAPGRCSSPGTTTSSRSSRRSSRRARERQRRPARGRGG